MEKLITVKGKGNISWPPDWIRITLELSAKDMDYQQTVSLAAKQLEDLRNSLKQEQFEKKDIKTTRFNVDTSFSSHKDRDGNYERIFDGYVLSQSLGIGFEIDSARLGRILSILAGCEAKPEFSIRYEIKDDRQQKNEILRDAVKNALEKATVIAEAASVTVGEVMQMDYDWSDVHFHREELMMSDSMSEAPIMPLDMQPDDIEASDTVRVVLRLA